MIYEPDSANDHESDDNNGRHVSTRPSATPRRPIASDPMDGAENWHREDHLNQRADSYEGKTEEELLDESNDCAVGFGGEWCWVKLRSAMGTLELLN